MNAQVAGPPRRDRRGRSARRFAVAAAGLMFALASVGCRERANTTTAPPTPPAVVAANPLRIETVTWDRYIGRFEAVRTVELRARVSGYLEAIHFDEGQIVSAGQLLFVIDPRPFEAVLARATAEHSEAEAHVTENRAKLAQAKAEENAASAVLDLARTRLDRAKRAAETNAVAEETVDTRSSELLQAEAALAAVRARIEAATASIDTALAGVQTAAAAVESARIDLEFTRITAPISGRIGRRIVQEGNLISGGSAGTTLLTTIVSIDPIHCYFDADEREFLKYARLAEAGARASSRDVKNPVYVALQDETGYPHVGHMDFVDNRLDSGTGTLRARAILPNPRGFLLPGLFATVRLPGGARRAITLIPDAAIVADQSDRMVYVIGENDVVEPRKITLGPMIEGLRSIESGIESVDLVVIRGLQRVRPGIKVAPTIETLTAEIVDDGLPDDYEPVPKERWLSIDETPTRADRPDPETGSGR